MIHGAGGAKKRVDAQRFGENDKLWRGFAAIHQKVFPLLHQTPISIHSWAFELSMMHCFAAAFSWDLNAVNENHVWRSISFPQPSLLAWSLHTWKFHNRKAMLKIWLSSRERSSLMNITMFYCKTSQSSVVVRIKSWLLVILNTLIVCGWG